MVTARRATTKRPTKTAAKAKTAKPAPVTDLTIAAHTAATYQLLDATRTATTTDQTTWRIAADHATVNAHEDGVTALFTAAEATHLGTAGAFDAALVAIAPILPGVLPHYVRLAKGVVPIPAALTDTTGVTQRLPLSLSPRSRPPADPYDHAYVDPGAATGEIYDAEIVATGEFRRPGAEMEPAFRHDPAIAEGFLDPDGGDRR